MGSLFFLVLVIVCILLVIVALCALATFVLGLLTLGFFISAKIKKKRNIPTNLSKAAVVCFIAFLLSSVIPVGFIVFTRTMMKPADYVDTGTIIQVSEEVVEEGHEFEYEGETLVPIGEDEEFSLPDETPKKAVCNLSIDDGIPVPRWILNDDATLYEVQNESEYVIYWVDTSMRLWCRKQDRDAILEYYKYAASKVFTYRDRIYDGAREAEWPDSSDEAGILNELSRYEHGMEIAKKEVWKSDVVSAWSIWGESTDGLWSDGWVIVITEDGVYEVVSAILDEWMDEDEEEEYSREAGVELSDELQAYIRKILIQ